MPASPFDSSFPLLFWAFLFSLSVTTLVLITSCHYCLPVSATNSNDGIAKACYPACLTTPITIHVLCLLVLVTFCHTPHPFLGLYSPHMNLKLALSDSSSARISRMRLSIHGSPSLVVCFSNWLSSPMSFLHNLGSRILHISHIEAVFLGRQPSLVSPPLHHCTLRHQLRSFPTIGHQLASLTLMQGQLVLFCSINSRQGLRTQLKWILWCMFGYILHSRQFIHSLTTTIESWYQTHLALTIFSWSLCSFTSNLNEFTLSYIMHIHILMPRHCKENHR